MVGVPSSLEQRVPSGRSTVKLDPTALGKAKPERSLSGRLSNLFSGGKLVCAVAEYADSKIVLKELIALQRRVLRLFGWGFR